MKKMLTDNKGITLVEILISLALALIIMVPALTFLINSMKSAQLEHNRIEVTKIARETLNGITSSVRKKAPEEVGVVTNYNGIEPALRLGTDHIFINGNNLVIGDITVPASLRVYKENIREFSITTLEGTDNQPKAILIEITVFNDNNISKTLDTTVYLRGR